MAKPEKVHESDYNAHLLFQEMIERVKRVFLKLSAQEKSIGELEKQRATWTKKVDEGIKVRDKVQVDIESIEDKITSETNKLYRLRRKTIIHFLALITGTLQRKIEKRDRTIELLSTQLEDKKRQRTNINKEIKNTQQEVDRLPNIAEAYKLLEEERDQFIWKLGTIDSKKYIEVREEIKSLASKLEGMNDVFDLGERAKEYLMEGKHLLKRAERWGVLDFFEGKGYSGHKKHQYINQANKAIMTAQSKRKLLEGRMDHIRHENDIDIRMHEVVVFADFFIDGAYVNLLVQEKIEESLRMVDVQMNTLHRLTNHLKMRYDIGKKEMKDLKEKRNFLYRKIEETTMND